jgi:hypothetical protein
VAVSEFCREEIAIKGVSPEESSACLGSLFFCPDYLGSALENEIPLAVVEVWSEHVPVL